MTGIQIEMTGRSVEMTGRSIWMSGKIRVVLTKHAIAAGFHTAVKHLFLSVFCLAESLCTSDDRANTSALSGIVTVTENRAYGCSDRHTNSARLRRFSGGIYLVCVGTALDKIILVLRFIDTTAINNRFIGTTHQEQR
jgi:hypothetical protein